MVPSISDDGKQDDSIAERLRSAGCVFADDEAELLMGQTDDPAELESMLTRRTGGEPLELVLGWAEFYGLRISVRPGVFVPRRRSEFLAEQALDVSRPGCVVLDMCCGTGALGLAIADSVDDVELHAAEIDKVAVSCARENLGPVGGEVYSSDLYSSVPDDLRGRINVLVANAPYVPTGEMDLLPREARLYESTVALDGGTDGLGIQRRVISGAHQWLAPGGSLLIEASVQQAPVTSAAMAEAGLEPQTAYSEELEATVIRGRSRRG